MYDNVQRTLMKKKKEDNVCNDSKNCLYHCKYI